MNGPARRRTFAVGLCLSLAGCAAQKLPIEPFASDTANSAPPTVVSDELRLSVDHGPAPESPYARQGATNEPPAQQSAPPSRAGAPVAFASNQAAGGPIAPRLPLNNTAAGAKGKGADSASIAQVVAELEALGPIDPAIQARLVEDLRQTDPSLWPTMMQTFKAGIAFKQRAAAGAAAKSERSTPEANTRELRSADAPSARDADPSASDTAVARAMPIIPPSVLAQLKSAESTDPFANLPLDALAGGGMAPRAGATPGLALPTQTILQAAMAEAQRRDEEQTKKVPPKAKVVVHVEPIDDEDPPVDAGRAKAKKDESETPADWRSSLEDVIAGLESRTRESPHNAAEVSQHAWLRMMYLAAGRREDALKPIPGIAAAEQDFWSEQIYGLATYLDTEKLTDPARRSAEARSHLAKAEKRLSEASTLAVRSLAFCTEVSSYGVYQKFKEDRFKAGQPVILYCEVENFRSEESAKGFHTALRSSYQILDPQGRRVAENDLALTEEYCQNERRDYFIRYFISVPERIYDGKYTLQLTIVDTLSQKIGQSTIDFVVGEEKK